MTHLFNQKGMIFLCTLILGFCSSMNSLYGATLHAILVGDTNDRKLGTAMQANINNVYDELRKISDLTELELNITMTSGKSAKRKHVLRQIKELDIQPDDTVIAYFSMHGYRTSTKTTTWPNLFFGEEYNGVSFDYILKTIKDKNPRLLIAMADSCNVYFPTDKVDTFGSLMAFGFGNFLTDLEKNNYKKLFLESSGVIIASGAVPGTVAWGIKDVGSLMTMAFLDSIHDVVLQEDDVSWEEILSQLETRIADYIKYHPSNVPKTQIPQYAIEIH